MAYTTRDHDNVSVSLLRIPQIPGPKKYSIVGIIGEAPCTIEEPPLGVTNLGEQGRHRVAPRVQGRAAQPGRVPGLTGRAEAQATIS